MRVYKVIVLHRTKGQAVMWQSVSMDEKIKQLVIWMSWPAGYKEMRNHNCLVKTRHFSFRTIHFSSVKQLSETKGLNGHSPAPSLKGSEEIRDQFRSQADKMARLKNVTHCGVATVS